MSYISAAFLLFAAAVVLLYFAVPKKFRWIVLLLASGFFYWLNSHWLLLVLVGTALATWGIGLAISNIQNRDKVYLAEHAADLSKEEKKAYREKSKRKTKALLLFGVLLILCILLFLKYWNFFVGLTNPLLSLIGLTAPTLNLLLPLGISFYSLQAMAYLIDLYRGKIKADRNPFQFLLFMSFFPQIVQGPIARHSQLAAQLYEGHSFDYTRLCHGIQLMLWGWFKKMVIADRIALIVNPLYDNAANYSGPILFLAAVFYGFQIYTDFSGGMDIARGFSHIIGIEMELNFNQPYFARSVEEFWRRWHITLGGWMRDYVFYPLSLSKAFNNLGKKARKLFGTAVGKKIPPVIAMFIVYFLVGFWHGSSLKYVAYGLWNGLFLMSGIFFAEGYEKAKKLVRIDDNTVTWRLFQMVRTFVICSFGRFFSRALSLKAALGMFLNTFRDLGNFSFLFDDTLVSLGLTGKDWLVLFISLLVVLFVGYLHEKGVHIRESISRQHLIFRWMIYLLAIAALMVFGKYGPGYNAANFIYERF